MHTNAPVERKQ